MQTVRILGLDPGLGRMGWGVIEVLKNELDKVKRMKVDIKKSKLGAIFIADVTAGNNKKTAWVNTKIAVIKIA